MNFAEEYINEDREFFEEIFSYKSEEETPAEKQAWVDWAIDIMSTHFKIDEDEAALRISIVEEYYEERGGI